MSGKTLDKQTKKAEEREEENQEGGVSQEPHGRV